LSEDGQGLQISDLTTLEDESGGDWKIEVGPCANVHVEFGAPPISLSASGVCP